MPLLELVNSSGLLKHFVNLYFVHHGDLVNLSLLDDVVWVVISESQTFKEVLEVGSREGAVVYFKFFRGFVLPDTLNAKYTCLRAIIASLISVIRLDGNGMLNIVYGTLNEGKITCKWERYSFLVKWTRSVSKKFIAEWGRNYLWRSWTCLNRCDQWLRWCEDLDCWEAVPHRI